MSLSVGSVVNFVERTHENLESTEQVIRDALLDTSVAGADETGMRVEGFLHWLHIMRDEQLLNSYLADTVCHSYIGNYQQDNSARETGS